MCDRRNHDYLDNASCEGQGRRICCCFIATALYAWISFEYAYYGELIISIAITTPMNVWGFVQWIKNRRQDEKQGKVVIVNKVKSKECLLLLASQLVMGVGYYFLLR